VSLTVSEYELVGAKTKIPRDFKAFLSSGSNKRQLARFLLSQWKNNSYAKYIQGHQIFFVCEENCVCLQSEDGVQVTVVDFETINTHQEEADTQIILHYVYASQEHHLK